MKKDMASEEEKEKSNIQHLDREQKLLVGRQEGKRKKQLLEPFVKESSLGWLQLKSKLTVTFKVFIFFIALNGAGLWEKMYFAFIKYFAWNLAFLMAWSPQLVMT